MFVLFVGPPVLTGPLWCGPENPRTALRSLGVAPKTGPQRSGPVWFAVLAVPFRGLIPAKSRWSLIAGNTSSWPLC